MTEENTVNQTEEKITKASEGDTIQVVNGEQKGKKGTVLMVRENSVIIKLGKNNSTGEPLKTVVNHKNYKIVK